MQSAAPDRVTVYCGYLWLPLSIVGVAIVASQTGHSEAAMEAADAHQVLTEMAHSPGATVVFLLVFLASILAGACCLWGLHRCYEVHDPRLSLGRMLALVAMVLFIGETLVSLSLVQGLAPFYLHASQAQQEVMQALGQTLLALRNSGAWLGSGLLGVVALLLARAKDHGKGARWLVILLWLGAACGLLGALTPWLSLLSPVRQLGLLMLPLWAMIWCWQNRPI